MGQLADFNINEIAGSIALIMGSLGGLCLIIFKSRCSSVSLCWGFWSCNRVVKDDDPATDADIDPPIVPPIDPPIAPPIAPPIDLGRP